MENNELSFGFEFGFDLNKLATLAKELQIIKSELTGSMDVLNNKDFLKKQIDTVEELTTKLNQFNKLVNTSKKTDNNTSPVAEIATQITQVNKEISKTQQEIGKLSDNSKIVKQYENVNKVISINKKELNGLYKQLQEVQLLQNTSTGQPMSKMRVDKQTKEIDALTTKILALENAQKSLFKQKELKFSNNSDIKQYEESLSKLAKLQKELLKLNDQLSKSSPFEGEADVLSKVNLQYKELILSSATLLKQEQMLLDALRSKKTILDSTPNQYKVGIKSEANKMIRNNPRLVSNDSSLLVSDQYKAQAQELAKRAYSNKNNMNPSEYSKLIEQSRNLFNLSEKAQAKEVEQLSKINQEKTKSVKLTNELSSAQKKIIAENTPQIENLLKKLNIDMKTFQSFISEGRDKSLYKAYETRLKTDYKTGNIDSNTELFKRNLEANKLFSSLTSNKKFSLDLEINRSNLENSLSQALSDQKASERRDIELSNFYKANSRNLMYNESKDIENLKRLQNFSQKGADYYGTKGDSELSQKYTDLSKRVADNIKKINEERQKGVNITKEQLTYDQYISNEIAKTRNDSIRKSNGSFKSSSNYQFFEDPAQFVNRESSGSRVSKYDSPVTPYARQNTTTSTQKLFYELSNLYYGIRVINMVLNPDQIMDYERKITSLGIAGGMSTPTQIMRTSNQIIGEVAGTPTSPTQYIDTLQEVIKTGRDYAEAQAIVQNANKIAGASFDNLATTTDVLNKQLMALDLEPTAERVTKFANQFHNALMNTALDVSGVSNAIKQSGTVFSALGQMAETAGVENLDAYKEKLFEYNLALTGELVQRGKSGGQAGTTIRNIFTKLTQLDNTGVKRLESDLQKATESQLQQAGFSSAKELQQLIQVDFQQAVNGVSKLINEGVISFSTIQKMFTERHSSSALALFSAVNGDLDQFTKKMTEGKDVVQDQTRAWANWASQIDAVKVNFSLIKQNMVSGFGSAPLLLGAKGLNETLTLLNKGIAGGNPFALALQSAGQGVGYTQLFNAGMSTLRNRMYQSTEITNSRDLNYYDKVSRVRLFGNLTNEKNPRQVSEEEANRRLDRVRVRIEQQQNLRLRNIDTMSNRDLFANATGISKIQDGASSIKTGALASRFNVDEATKYGKALNGIELAGKGVGKVLTSGKNLLLGFLGSPAGILTIINLVMNASLRIYQSYENANVMLASSQKDALNALKEMQQVTDKIYEDLTKPFSPTADSYLNTFTSELQKVIDKSTELSNSTANAKKAMEMDLKTPQQYLDKMRSERLEEVRQGVNNAKYFNNKGTDFSKNPVGWLESVALHLYGSATDEERLRGLSVKADLENINFKVKNPEEYDLKTAKNAHEIATQQISKGYETAIWDRFKKTTEFAEISDETLRKQALFEKYALTLDDNRENFFQKFEPLAEKYNIQLDKTVSSEQNLLIIRAGLTSQVGQPKADELIMGQIQRAGTAEQVAGELKAFINLISKEDTEALKMFYEQLLKIRSLSDEIKENATSYISNQAVKINSLTGGLFVPNMNESFFRGKAYDEAQKAGINIQGYETQFKETLLNNPRELMRSPQATLEYTAQLKASFDNEITLLSLYKKLEKQNIEEKATLLPKQLQANETEMKNIQESLEFEKKKREAIQNEYRMSVFTMKKREELLQAEMKNSEARLSYLNSARSAFGFRGGDLENMFLSYRNNLQYMNEVGYDSFKDQLKVFNDSYLSNLRMFGISDPSRVSVDQVNNIGRQIDNARYQGATNLGGIPIHELQLAHGALTSIVNERISLDNREIEIAQQRRNLEIEIIKIELERNKLSSIYIDSLSLQNQKASMDVSSTLNKMSGVDSLNKNQLLVQRFYESRDYTLQKATDQLEYQKLQLRQSISNKIQTINAIKMLENSEKQNTRLVTGAIKQSTNVVAPKVDNVSKTVDVGDKQEFLKLTDINNSILGLNQSIMQALAQSTANAVTDFGDKVTNISGNTALEAILNGVSKNETGIADYRAVKAVGQVVADTAKNGKTSYSYGAFGINDLLGSMKEFLSYKDYGNKFGLSGLTMSSDAFKAQWKKMAETNTQAFADAQADFILNKSNPASAKKHMKQGLDPKFWNSMGIYGILVDSYVQEGAGGRTANNITSGKYKNIKDYDALVRAMYNDSNKTYQNRQNVRYFEMPKAVANAESNIIAGQTNKTIVNGVINPLNQWANNLVKVSNMTTPAQKNKTLVGDNNPNKNTSSILNTRTISNLNNVHSAWKPILEETRRRYPNLEFTVTDGHRTAEEQNKIYKQSKKDGVWRTSADGYNNKSRHQSGLAIDIYPSNNGKVNLNGGAKQEEIIRAVMATAKSMGVGVEAGLDWKKNQDPPHLQLSKDTPVNINYYGGSQEYGAISGYTAPEPQFRLGDDTQLYQEMQRLKSYELTKDLVTNQNTLYMIQTLTESAKEQIAQGLTTEQAYRGVFSSFLDSVKGQIPEGLDVDTIRQYYETAIQAIDTVYSEFAQLLDDMTNNYLEMIRGIEYGSVLVERERQRTDTQIRNLRNTGMSEVQRLYSDYQETVKDRDAYIQNAETQRAFQVNKDFQLRNTLINAFGIDRTQTKDQIDTQLFQKYVKSGTLQETRQQYDEIKLRRDQIALETRLTQEQLTYYQKLADSPELSSEERKKMFMEMFESKIFSGVNLDNLFGGDFSDRGLEKSNQGLLSGFNIQNQTTNGIFQTEEGKLKQLAKEYDELLAFNSAEKLLREKELQLTEQRIKVEEARRKVIDHHIEAYGNAMKNITDLASTFLFEGGEFKRYTGQDALNNLLNNSNLGKYLVPEYIRDENGKLMTDPETGKYLRAERPELTSVDFLSGGVDAIAIFDEMLRSSLETKKQELSAQEKMLEMQLQMANTTKERRDIEDNLLQIQKQKIDLEYQAQTTFMGGLASGTSGGALQGLTGGLSQGLGIVGALGASNPIGWGLTAGLGVFGAIGGAKSSLNAYASAQQEKANLEAQQKLTRVIEDQTKYLKTISESTQETAKWITKIGVVDATNRGIYSTIGVDPESFGGTASETYTVGKKKKKWGGLVSKSWSENRVETASINLADSMFGGREFEDVGDIEWALATLQSGLLNNSLLQGFTLSGGSGGGNYLGGFNPFKKGTQAYIDFQNRMGGSGTGATATSIVNPDLMTSAQDYLSYMQAQSGIEVSADQFKAMVLGNDTLDTLGIRKDLSGQGSVNEIISILEGRLSTASRSERVQINAQLDLMKNLMAVLDREGKTTKRQFGQYYGFETEEIKDENGNITEYRRIDESVWSKYYEQVAKNTLEGTKSFDTAQTVIQGTLNAYIQNSSNQRTPIKQITEDLNTLSDELYEMITRTGNLSNVDAQFKKLIQSNRELQDLQKEADELNVELARKWVDNGGLITDALQGMNNGLTTVMNAIKDGLTGESMESNLDSFGKSIFNTLSDAMTDSLLNNTYAQDIFKLNQSLTSALESSSVSNIVDVANEYQGIVNSMENERDKMNALANLFSSNRDLDYMDENISYTTGSSQQITYNTNLTQQINVSGNVLADPVSMDLFIESIAPLIDRFAKERGLFGYGS